MYRAIDHHGQVIDVLVSPRRDAEAARRFFTRALLTFVQNLRRGDYELGHDLQPPLRVAAAFTELARTI